MNNRERKEYYLNQAKEEYKQMNYYFDKENWNMVIRKAQEVIEFLLKGVLKYLNIEFPKEHDIGEYFEKILIRRKLDYDSDSLRKIVFASKELVNKRAPAYYGEEFYSKKEAIEAKRDAEFTKNFIQELMKRIEKIS